MGLLTDFKKEMQQTELHACHLVHVEVPVNSLLLKHNTAQLNRVRKQRRCDQTRERPYHKTIPIVFAPRLLQIGDNQGPDAYDVGNDVDQMGHTQIVGENGLFQYGREDFQSRVSAPFNLLTMNSVIASPSKLPKTLEEVRCKQRLQSRRSETG